MGFVFCYKILDEIFEFLDFFLIFLIDEIVYGFIDGIEVEYIVDFFDFDI